MDFEDDDEYSLIGVPNWSQTATAPLERLAVSPEFVGFHVLLVEKPQVVVNFWECHSRLFVRHCQSSGTIITGQRT